MTSDEGKIRLFGEELTRAELLDRVGHVAQVADVRLYEFTNGNERGVRAAEFNTGSGFEFTVLLDRGMDIDDARYNGRPISWESPTGPVSPAFYDSRGSELVRQFQGGLLVGCGPTYFGVPNVDQGVELGLHGRLSNIPAKDVSVRKGWQGNRYVMSVEGHMDEVGIWVDCLQVSRRIETALGESRLRMTDIVENVGFQASPFSMLYHCQVGWPILSPDARLYVKSSQREPWSLGPVDLDQWDRFQAPTAGYAEQLIYHTVEPDRDGMANVAVINSAFGGGQGYGVYYRWTQDTLPYMVEWKMMGRKAYVVGIEPANGTSEGRAANRQAGILRTLQPGETAEIRMEIGLLTNQDEIEAWLSDHAAG